MEYREYSLEELADRLNLDYNNSGNMHCPFCEYPDPDRRNLHMNFSKNFWRCNKCKTSGGVLHLFSQYVLHEPLPSSKAGKREVWKKLTEYMGGDSQEANPLKRKQKPKPPEVPVANDDHLHKVYSAMAMMPVLQLTKEHLRKLKVRGLSEDVIVRNQYRSIPENFDIPDMYHTMYKKAGGETIRNSLFSWYSPRMIKLGLMIAHTLTSAGLDLQGVPGFYKFGDAWCMWAHAGLLIPTRNYKGQIVGWQTRRSDTSRKNSKQPKYSTLGCGNYPGAVTDSISRCHFPLANAAIGENVPVCYTEGPLKADVTCELMGRPVIMLAIPGINTTKDLLNVLQTLKGQGYNRVCNCLDMDRLTNPNVQHGNRVLKSSIQALGIEVQDMFWGSQYAQQKYMMLAFIAQKRHVSYSISPFMSVFERLDAVSEALNNAGIDACRKVNKGTEKLYYWDSETKGIDDYYFSEREKAQNMH